MVNKTDQKLSTERLWNVKVLEKSCCHLLSYVEILIVTICIINYSDSKRTARALCNGPTVSDVLKGDLELVTTGARIVESSRVSIKIKVFNFNFVVNFCRHNFIIIKLFLLQNGV